MWFPHGLLLAALAGVPTPSPTLPTREEIHNDLVYLSEASGFRIRHEVAFRSITRDEVGRYIHDRMKESIDDREVRAEELTLKKFGFAPADFDLRKQTETLLTEQAAAFYDYRTKQLYITDWAQNRMRSVAILHELAHALADQNFSIDKYLKKAARDSERSAARQAVVEGQATLLESIVEQAHPAARQDESAAERTDYPEFDHSPLYFRETLIFPYMKGSLFQQAVTLREGKPGFRTVFERAPVSTQQILEPELYFVGESPTKPALPGVPRNLKLRGVVSGTLGQLEHEILLRQYDSESTARELGPKWRGASYAVLETKDQGRAVLVYASEWKTAEAARQFFDCYQKVMKGKWKNFAVETRERGVLRGRGDDGYFSLEWKDRVVTSREGWPERF